MRSAAAEAGETPRLCSVQHFCGTDKHRCDHDASCGESRAKTKEKRKKKRAYLINPLRESTFFFSVVIFLRTHTHGPEKGQRAF